MSGRALSGLPTIANLTRGDPQVLKLVDGLEGFLTRHAEDKLWFTGQHPDLHGGDFEPNSVWGAVEFRLGTSLSGLISTIFDRFELDPRGHT